MSEIHFSAADLTSIVGKHIFRRGNVSGDVTITQEGDTFLAEWSSDRGGRLTGVGFGRRGHIAFARAPNEQPPGLVEYHWDNNRLQARWTMSSVPKDAIALGHGTLV